MSDFAVSVRNVRKSFGRHPVLEDVTFNIPAGETWALLGRNGVGKTTLIRSLLGLLAVDGGTMQVAGCDPVNSPIELRRRVGYLAEDQSMYGWMTANELCQFLQPFYPTWSSRTAHEYLDRFAIPRHTRIDRLSKGQGVKLGLVAALAHAPQVAILDDPALGLDPISRKEFNRDLVEHLQAEGRTVIYSSHLLSEVEAVADQVAILERGKIVRQGATEMLRDQIRRLAIPREFARRHQAPDGLIDAVPLGEQMEVVIDGPNRLLEQLSAQGLQISASAMTLDDIFEAYVTGRPERWAEH